MRRRSMRVRRTREIPFRGLESGAIFKVSSTVMSLMRLYQAARGMNIILLLCVWVTSAFYTNETWSFS